MTIAILIPLLARETMEGRTINPEDILALKEFYPDFYDSYTEACDEWSQMREAKITREISYADLVEKSTSALLKHSKAQMLSRHEGAYRIHTKFPTYGFKISEALVKLLRKRAIWIGEERKLRSIAYRQLPDLALGQIAYHLALG